MLNIHATFIGFGDKDLFKNTDNLSFTKQMIKLKEIKLNKR